MPISIDSYDDYVMAMLDVKGDTLEVDFTGSEYEDGVYNISCSDNYELIAFRADTIARLIDSTMNLCGKTVELQHMVFDSRRISSPTLAAQVEDSVTLTGCAWLQSFLEEQQGLSILHIVPRSDATDLKLESSWLIGNLTNAGHHIIGFRSQSTGGFASMTFEQTAFIDNRADFVIGALVANRIDVQSSFVMVRDDATVFLGARTKGASIAFSDCTIIAPSLKQVVTQWASDAKAGDFNPVEFTNCHIYVTGDDAVPDGINLTDSHIQKIAAMSDEDFDAWVGLQVENARAGKIPDADALRQSLNLS